MYLKNQLRTKKKEIVNILYKILTIFNVSIRKVEGSESLPFEIGMQLLRIYLPTKYVC